MLFRAIMKHLYYVFHVFKYSILRSQLVRRVLEKKLQYLSEIR